MSFDGKELAIPDVTCLIFGKSGALSLMAGKVLLDWECCNLMWWLKDVDLPKMQYNGH